MACGCAKKNTNPVANALSANTVYQVLDGVDRSVKGEFSTIQEARTKAAEIKGSVRVATKRN